MTATRPRRSWSTVKICLDKHYPSRFSRYRLSVEAKRRVIIGTDPAVPCAQKDAPTLTKLPISQCVHNLSMFTICVRNTFLVRNCQSLIRPNPAMFTLTRPRVTRSFQPVRTLSPMPTLITTSKKSEHQINGNFNSFPNSPH